MSTPVPLRLAGVVRRSFGRADDAADPRALRFHRDLAASFGVTFDAELLAHGNRNSFTAMCLDAWEALGDLAGPLDLIVLAHAVPDIDVGGRYAAAALAHRVPGEPPAFAVGDQGVATSFTALRIVSEYVRVGAATRVLVMLLDQSTVPYRTPNPTRPEPGADTAVGLVFAADPAAGAGLAIDQFAGVAADEVRPILARVLADLAPAETAVTVLAGSGIDGADLAGVGAGVGARVVTVPAGRMTTGLWCDLRPHDPGRDAPSAPLVLIDYDRTLRYLCVATIRGAHLAREDLIPIRLSRRDVT